MRMLETTKMKYFGAIIFMGIGIVGSSVKPDEMVQIDAKTFKGCEGEGCGCTHDQKTNKSFELFEKMDKHSKLIASFKANTVAEAIAPFTILTKPGKIKVTGVLDSSSGLKAGDELSPVFYEGEGIMRAKLGGKWVDFSEDSIKFKKIQESQSQNWLELKVGDKHGYTPSFPFTNCLE
jgi:hypothetical protein